MENQEQLNEMLDYFLNEMLDRVILSNPREKERISKAIVRPVIIKNQLCFQVEELIGKQAFHKNLDKKQLMEYLETQLAQYFKSGEILSKLGSAHILVSKKGTVTIKQKRERPSTVKISPEAALLSHNRKKRYILEEGKKVPFLISLGVMTEEGKVVKARYDKFRQINRFLEFVEDILPKLEKKSVNTIIDFGCGKSYLTFAMYYYLKEMKGYPVRIIGLDLKTDVINLCNRLSREFGFEALQFFQGDIADYEGVDKVDMVVTLHACDTATDYALAKAVAWGAKVILSVPCCQHELNNQIENELLAPVFQYGLLKERISALMTDGIRARLLERQGYKTQILEFIDMEHTPKNILIRAVKQGEAKKDKGELDHLLEEFHINPTLSRLFSQAEEERVTGLR